MENSSTEVIQETLNQPGPSFIEAAQSHVPEELDPPHESTPPPPPLPSSSSLAAAVEANDSHSHHHQLMLTEDPEREPHEPTFPAPLPEYDLGIPQLGSFESRQELVDAVKAFGRTHGFGVVLGPSGKHAHGSVGSGPLRCQRYGEYQCKRARPPKSHTVGDSSITPDKDDLAHAGPSRAATSHHPYQNALNNARKTTKSGCRFELHVARTAQGDRPWQFRVKYPLHNHPADNPQNCSTHRRPTQEQVEFIVEQLLQNENASAALNADHNHQHQPPTERAKGGGGSGSRNKVSADSIIRALDQRFPGHMIQRRHVYYQKERLVAMRKKEEEEQEGLRRLHEAAQNLIQADVEHHGGGAVDGDGGDDHGDGHDDTAAAAAAAHDLETDGIPVDHALLQPVVDQLEETPGDESRRDEPVPEPDHVAL